VSDQEQSLSATFYFSEDDLSKHAALENKDVTPSVLLTPFALANHITLYVVLLH
jgi:hypothetical protein